MTMSPGAPGPTDFEGKEAPPYEGRRETADVDGEEKLHRDGANVGGATGPVESEGRKAPEPAETPRGAPADEQPAHEHDDGGPEQAEGTARMTEAVRVLVAGIGNVFRSDDGFGSEVVRRLAGESWPEGVRVRDYGIRGLHLSYDLLEPWDALVLVDAVPGRGAAGSVAVLDIGPDDVGAVRAVDAHSMDPSTVLASLAALGGGLPARTLLVGCQVAETADGMGLTPPVEAAVPAAVATVRDLVIRELRATEVA